MFYSCQDITDIGTVHKYPIYPPPPDGTASTIVKPDSSYWLILEGFPDKYDLYGLVNFAWAKKMKFLRNDITIDTLDDMPKISIDVYIESTFPDVLMSDRKDRIQSFRFKLDSVELSNGLLKEVNISNWFEIYMKTLIDKKTYYLNQDDLKVEWVFVETITGIISGYFQVFIPNNLGYETKLLTFTFDLYYPYKKIRNK